MAIIPTAMSISTVVPPTSQAGTTAGTMVGTATEVVSLVVEEFMEAAAFTVEEADVGGNSQMSQLPDALIRLIGTLTL